MLRAAMFHLQVAYGEHSFMHSLHWGLKDVSKRYALERSSLRTSLKLPPDADIQEPCTV